MLVMVQKNITQLVLVKPKPSLDDAISRFPEKLRDEGAVDPLVSG